MKLLFDVRLCAKLQDSFPGSQHVRELGLERASDLSVWTAAKEQGFVIVSKDADFNELTIIRGHPPQIVWLRTGNVRTAPIATLLRTHREDIERAIAQGIGIIEIA